MGGNEQALEPGRILCLCGYVCVPLDIRLLGAQSERAQAYAKCLKYREMEYQQVGRQSEGA